MTEAAGRISIMAAFITLDLLQGVIGSCHLGGKIAGLFSLVMIRVFSALSMR